MTAQEIEMTTTTIQYPSAEDLDTGGISETSGFKQALYLIPAGETEDGIPKVTTHCGVGNIGTPMPAWNNRWASIGSYGPQVVGQSVLDALQSIEAELIATSYTYIGSEWNGSNFLGRWQDVDGEPACYVVDEGSLSYAFEQCELACYWHAADWYCGGGLYAWGDFSDKEPSDEEIERVIAACEAEAEDDGALVTGIEEYIQQLAEVRIEELAEEAEEAEEDEED